MKKIIVISAFLFMLSGCSVYIDDDRTPSPKYQDDKVTICHKGKTKIIPKAALKGHLKHGDYRGPCR